MKIEKSTIHFLKDLKENNNRDWFEKNKSRYESSKENFLEFTTELIKRIEKFDGLIHGVEPKKTIFRIYRDVRFSKDKSPYKTNMGANIQSGQKMENRAGYYFHLDPVESFAAGGCYMPAPADLLSIRQEIDYHLTEFQKILNSKNFKSHFDQLDVIEKLKTVPKGFEAENGAIEYLKHKSFIVSEKYKGSILTSSELCSLVAESFKTLKPLNDFLNRAIYKDN